jgi:SET domain-containing protein
LPVIVPNFKLSNLRVQKSKIHGKGVFTAVAILKDTCLGEYEGRRYKTAQEINKPFDSSLFYFWGLTSGEVIDASEGGNCLRFANHSCTPNMTSREVRIKYGNKSYLTVVYIALRDIAEGEELTLDYHVQPGDSDLTHYLCKCGSSACRGTMLDPKLEASHG